MKTPLPVRLLLATLSCATLALSLPARASDVANPSSAPTGQPTLAPSSPSAPRPSVGSSAETRTKAGSTNQTAHPKLHLLYDGTPINRNAPDRVSYAPIVKKTAASVVFVYSTKKVPGQDLTPFLNDPLFRRFFNIPGHGGGGGQSGRMPEQTELGLGSGIIISKDGYILTNNHVVAGADQVQVSIGQDTKKIDAKVIGRDSLSDIAVLKITPPKPLVPAVFGNSDQLEVGDVVLAIGDPFGIGQSVSRGIVSALGRGQLGIEQLEDFIQTDAAINPGNSGGALIDSEGRVVGINTAILSASGGFAGVGFAIPINLVRFVAEQIVNKGHVDRGFLGVQTQDLSSDLAAEFHSDHGALVSDVTEDSPARKAGIQAGDVITKINQTDIRDPRHLQLLITQMAPGTEVKVGYERNGKSYTANVKLGLRPGNVASSEGAGAGGGNDNGVLNGVSVGDITSDIRQQLQIPPRITGAVIMSVDPDSASAEQGLQQGDVIMELDHKPVHNADAAVKLSEEIKGPKVLVLIWRNGGTRFVVVDESKK